MCLTTPLLSHLKAPPPPSPTLPPSLPTYLPHAHNPTLLVPPAQFSPSRHIDLLTCNPAHSLGVISTGTYAYSLLQYPCLRLDGSTGLNKRQKLVVQFNDQAQQQFVFLLSSKAGGWRHPDSAASHIASLSIAAPQPTCVDDLRMSALKAYCTLHIASD